ncbi:MAG: hypothetical protein J5993_05920 [Clostridia bacterium]|nr:hypothetical protein [Clostridia bacterium]
MEKQLRKSGKKWKSGKEKEGKERKRYAILPKKEEKTSYPTYQQIFFNMLITFPSY